MDRKISRNKRTYAYRTKKCKPQNLSQSNSLFASTSAQKHLNEPSLETSITSNFQYCILEFFAAFSALSNYVVCKDCNGNVTFSRSNKEGVGFKLLMKCNCAERFIPSSSKIQNKTYEINRHLIFVLRFLGIGIRGFNKFCGLMDLCEGMLNESYYASLESIQITTFAVYDIVLRKAVDEEKEANVTSGKISNHLTAIINDNLVSY